MNPDDLTQEVKNRYKKLIDEGADPNEGPTRGGSEYNRGGFKAVDMLNDEVINQDKCVDARLVSRYALLMFLILLTKSQLIQGIQLVFTVNFASMYVLF